MTFPTARREEVLERVLIASAPAAAFRCMEGFATFLRVADAALVDGGCFGFAAGFAAFLAIGLSLK